MKVKTLSNFHNLMVAGLLFTSCVTFAGTTDFVEISQDKAAGMNYVPGVGTLVYYHVYKNCFTSEVKDQQACFSETPKLKFTGFVGSDSNKPLGAAQQITHLPGKVKLCGDPIILAGELKTEASCLLALNVTQPINKGVVQLKTIS